MERAERRFTQVRGSFATHRVQGLLDLGQFLALRRRPTIVRLAPLDTLVLFPSIRGFKDAFVAASSTALRGDLGQPATRA